MTEEELKKAISTFQTERDNFRNETQAFEKSKVAYEQNSEMFRSLNQLMWQVPILAMTLTGGTWLAVGTMNVSALVKTELLIFTTVANVGFIILLSRLRYIIGQYLEKLEAFSKADHVAAKGENQPWHRKPHVVVETFTAFLSMAAAISFVGFVVLLVRGTL